ncbi:M20/M25/M40 family metallo-hydrolase [Streptomyces sp. MN13]
MDAVDEDEQQPGEFASQVPCGHDLHTAIGVGIAEVLAQLRERLNGRVVWLFQPAEETLSGARAMLEDGVLERTALQRLADLIDGFSTIRYPQSPGEFQQLLEDLRTPAGPLTPFVFARSQLTWTDEHAEVRAWSRAWPDSRYAEIRNELRSAVDALPDTQITFQGQPFPSVVCSPELSEGGRTPAWRSRRRRGHGAARGLSLQRRGLRAVPAAFARSDVHPRRRQPGSGSHWDAAQSGLRR